MLRDRKDRPKPMNCWHGTGANGGRSIKVRAGDDPPSSAF
jgi:hypothetical protein